MNWIIENKDLLLMVSPIVLIQLMMFAYCAIIISKEGVANLNKTLWLIIALFLNLIGPILFLTLGRKDK